MGCTTSKHFSSTSKRQWCCLKTPFPADPVLKNFYQLVEVVEERETLNMGSGGQVHPSFTTFLGDRRRGFVLLPLNSLWVWGFFRARANVESSKRWAEETSCPQKGTTIGRCTRPADTDMHDEMLSGIFCPDILTVLLTLPSPLLWLT